MENSNLWRGVACMLGGSAVLTLNDALMKWTGAAIPVGQTIAVRGLFATALILLWALYADGGLRRLRVGSWRGPGAWGLIAVGSTFLFLSSLRYLPLADATALTFAGPLFVAALAPLFLGETVRWRRRIGVAAGFAGVLLILKPGTEAFRWVALLPLAVALLEAVRDMLARHMAAREGSLALVFVSTAAVTLAGIASLARGWEPMGAGDVGLLALAACFQVVSHFLMVDSFRFGEAAVISPFRYASVLWAAAIGFVWWGDGLDAWMVLGTGLLVLSGLYLLRQSRRG